MALLLSFIAPSVMAAPAAPKLLEADWRTGEINVCYSGVTPGNVVYVYAAKWDKPFDYVPVDFWVSEVAEGCHVTKFFENGQSVWYYIKQMDDDLQFSPASNSYKQTPPITAYIINWPDMMSDLMNGMKDLNDALIESLENLAKPSDSAMNDLKDAIDGLKNAVGAGQVGQIGGGLNNGLDGIKNGLNPPAVVDDGNGTYTGGNTGGQLPSKPITGAPIGGGDGLEYNDPNSGTSNDLTFSLPYGVDMQGNLLYVKILTNEQLEKMKWLAVVRTLAEATLYILFAFWLVTRFSPQMKV